MKSLLSLCVLSAVLLSSAFAKKVVPNIILNENEVLQVTFSYSADLKIAQSDPSLARNMEREAGEEFREAFEALLEEVELPVAVEIVENGKRPDKALPLLSINAIRWETNSSGELEAVISAKLQDESKQKNKLGSFTAREPAPVQMAKALEKTARIKVMKAVLVDLLAELNTHFPSPLN